uniref:Fimbrial protein n=1 Tax=Syphacia muris TaxID=451379 RepID=A0A0N5ALM2_9BILA
MCLYLRVFICTFTWLISQALVANFDLEVSRNTSTTFTYPHPLTSSLHVTLTSDNPIQLYVSSCSTDKGNFISKAQNINQTISSAQLYDYLKNEKCQDTDLFYRGSEPSK